MHDGAGQPVRVPPRVERVFPAGPPAAVLLYTLAPDLLLGWPRAFRPEERAFLLPDAGGRLTGRGDTANLETVLQLRPDLILDAGSTDGTYVSLADRVQAQAGVPYALLDGGLSAAALGAAVGILLSLGVLGIQALAFAGGPRRRGRRLWTSATRAG